MTKPEPPDYLDERGRGLWLEVTGAYDLRVDELTTLEDYCAMADEIADLRAEHVALGRPRMTRGSMGQEVDHPLPKRITDLQMKRATLARQLKLPDENGEARNQHRDAANARWAKRGA